MAEQNHPSTISTISTRSTIEADRFDYRRFVFLHRKRFVRVLAAALIGALLFGGLRLLYWRITSPEVLYRSQALYYIDFDGDYAEELQFYYNAYTWNDVLLSDRILGRMGDVVSRYGIGKLRERLSIPMLSDIRMFVVYADWETPEDAAVIQAGVKEALAEFAEETEGFLSIEQWSLEEGKEIRKEKYLDRFMILGAVCGFIAGILWLCYRDAVSDEICTEEELRKVLALRGWEKEGTPLYAGITFAANKSGGKVVESRRLWTQKAKKAFPKDVKEIDALKLWAEPDKLTSGKTPWVLCVPYGMGANRLSVLIGEIERAGNRPLAVWLTEADPVFYERYYR